MIKNYLICFIKSKRLEIKAFIVTALVVIYYFWLPHFYLLDEVAKINVFYTQFQYQNANYLERAFASITVIFFGVFSAHQFAGLINDIKPAFYIKNCRNFSTITLLIMGLSSIPLVVGFFLHEFKDRESAYVFIDFWRHRPIVSIIFTLSLVSSLLLFINGEPRNLILLLLVGVLPELLYGTRVSAFRVFFILSVFFPWRPLYIIALFFMPLLIAFSRILFGGYGFNDFYSILILFSGDPINVALGTSFLFPNLNYSCGVDGYHIIRALLPPVFGLRDTLNQYCADITICLNSMGFGVGAPFGLGGSPINDLVVSPLSFCISSAILLFLCFYLVKLLPAKLALAKFSVPLIVLCCIPYVMRNGMVSTVNHVVTIFIWVLLPMCMIFVLDFGRMFAWKRRS